MNRKHMLTITAAVMLACGGTGLLRAAHAPTTPPAAKPAADSATAYKTWADGKADKFLDPLKVADTAKLAAAKALVSQYCITMRTWHDQHKDELAKLWADWNEARKPTPKDEYPGEVVAQKIDELFASLKPDYEAFDKKLGEVLTPEQVDGFKEAWSRSPGMKRTYNAYLDMAPGLKDEDKKAIYNWMYQAREAAMLTDQSKEIDNTFKVYKVKVEAYIGTLEYQKLRVAWINKGSAPKTKTGTTAPAAE